MFYFGVDYYPEHWPEERWSYDADLMAEAGFNIARLGEFAWSRFEPSEGNYDFGWLDRAIEILSDREIRIVLGTPTASAPPWVMAKSPEMFRMLPNGSRVPYGHRREYCPNNPTYIDLSKRIVSALAEHYAERLEITGWQIDNEFGDRCYCPICAAAFHAWLRDRYGTLPILNQVWGTAFWSHEYTDWNQIPTPLADANPHNPGLALDFKRFASDSYVAFQKMQIDILRGKCPGHLITHNFMGFKYPKLDYFDLARDLDFVSWDNYLRMQWTINDGVDSRAAALGHDTMRGLKGRNFWVMEQQSGGGGWECVSVSPRPGEIRLWTYQAIAHGADGIIYFRWRTNRFGAEQYWHGVLDHHGIPGHRYEEIKRIGKEIRNLGETLVGARIESDVALLLSYDSRFSFQVQQGNPDFDYGEHFQDVYSGFAQQNISVDVVQPLDDLDKYRLVIAPALHVVSDAVAENLKRFVQGCGVLVFSARCGVKDVANAVVDRQLPGVLSEMCGTVVEEYDSLPTGVENELEVDHGIPIEGAIAAKYWCDVLKTDQARVVARYTRNYYAGKPAITLNNFGDGKVVYLGTFGEEATYASIAPWLMSLAGVETGINTSRAIEVGVRIKNDKRFLFILNHGAKDEVIKLDKQYHDLLTDIKPITGDIHVAPLDVKILIEIA
ncbi:MAG: beta-galactosidase [Anaerolineales bacterium]|nr:MAG: beta-galactosidase [Anaerolineales bacterium]